VLNKKITLNAGLSSRVGDRDEIILYADYFGQYNKDFKSVGINSFPGGHNDKP